MMKKLLVLALLLFGTQLASAQQGTPLSGLSSGSAISSTDIFYDVQTTGSGGVKVTATQLATFMWASPTFTGTVTGPDSATWASGGISGTKINSSTIGATTAAAGKFTTLNASGQMTSTTGLPTIASGACGATTNGAVVAGSTNQSGQITIGSATTTTCTISWSATLAVAPNMCVFFPMNATAAATGTTVAYVSAPTTSGVVLNGSALASANYGYVCL